MNLFCCNRQRRWVHSLYITIPNKLFPGYVIQYHISRVHFSSNILIRVSIFGIWFLAKEHFWECWECWSNASPPNLKDKGISLRLTSHPYPVHSTRDLARPQAHSPGTKYLRQGGDTFDWDKTRFTQCKSLSPPEHLYWLLEPSSTSTTTTSILNNAI